MRPPDLVDFMLDPPPSRADQIFARFKEFHAANPEVWRLFQRFALEAANAGHSRYGIAMVMERIRWHVDIETKGGTAVKLNNDFRAYYARMFMVKYPHLPLFEVRKRLSAERVAFDIDIEVFDVGMPRNEDGLRAELARLA